MIGILALQGGFLEHIMVLRALNFRAREVRTPADFDGLTGLILPGGESTVMSRFLEKYNLRNIILEKARDPSFTIYGTCAGLILLAKTIEDASPNGASLNPLGLLDISVKRNAYGRQVQSFIAEVEIAPAKNSNGNSRAARKIRAGHFIRAPKITRIGRDIEVLATLPSAENALKETPVFIRQKNIWGSTFHPELAPVTMIHDIIFSGMARA